MSLHVARHMTWVLKPCQMWKWFAALHIYFGKCIPASCITICVQVSHRDITCIQKVGSHPFSHIIFSYSSTIRLGCCTTLVFDVTSIATKYWITFALHSWALWTCLVDMINSYTFLLWRHCLYTCGSSRCGSRPRRFGAGFKHAVVSDIKCSTYFIRVIDSPVCQ